MYKQVLIGAALLLTGQMIGCGAGGPRPVAVSGSITYKGSPVEGATVTFLNQDGGKNASGVTDAEGKYVLTVEATGDGAYPGSYAVTVVKAKSKFDDEETDIGEGNYGEAYGAMMDAAASGSMSKVMKDQLPKRYSSVKNSGLAAIVKSGVDNNFDFTLEGK